MHQAFALLQPATASTCFFHFVAFFAGLIPFFCKPPHCLLSGFTFLGIYQDLQLFVKPLDVCLEEWAQFGRAAAVMLLEHCLQRVVMSISLLRAMVNVGSHHQQLHEGTQISLVQSTPPIIVGSVHSIKVPSSVHLHLYDELLLMLLMLH